MLTIQRNYFKDFNATKGKINFKKMPKAPELYRAIADYLGVESCDIPYGNTKETQGIEVELLRDRIDAKNAELACAGVPVAAKLVKPVLRRDRVKVQPPVKRPKIKVAGGLEVATMRPVKVAKPKLKVKVN